MTSLEKLDVLGEDLSELSKDVGSLLDSSMITLKRLDYLALKEQSELSRNTMLSRRDKTAD